MGPGPLNSGKKQSRPSHESNNYPPAMYSLHADLQQVVLMVAANTQLTSLYILKNAYYHSAAVINKQYGSVTMVYTEQYAFTSYFTAAVAAWFVKGH